MTQEQLNTLSELLADFKSEYTDIDNDGYWNVEEVEGLVDSAISATIQISNKKWERE